MNVINNSYTHENIEVWKIEQQDWVCVCVLDTGKGMKLMQMRKIFL